ncbi:MAG TPA: class II fructose-bisphosphatase [Peptococcaceae bacterium]|nr:class II fructose-bisphosphatase [Clostridia bacterium]HOB81707.1 class II fructose-bisphosphatase [Peptococcaceae bacterium]HPZ70937.1 class II fructose-bisphosphatase [Peptococcaceae bacterium]HQD54343.1 class II fructose-bisphosphatase [Peptococcaceae bacterium]
MERELTLEFARVTEAAAIASARWWGRGDKNAADDAATEAMRAMFDTVNIDGTVVIGEGEMDEAPMLYIGEKVGRGHNVQVDVAVDPLEGTNLVAKGLMGAIAVLAVAPKGCLLHAPDMYMEKIAAGPAAVGKISLDASVTENVRAVARSLHKDIADVTVVVLDRERHRHIIEELRRIGARIKLISDGDVSPAVATSIPGSGVDMVIGIGGAPEGVLAAAALRCTGGEFQGRLWPENAKDIERCKKLGVTDPRKILTLNDLVRGEDVIFAATGVTDGDFLKGVRYYGNYATTHTVVMRGVSGTIRFLEARHRMDKKTQYTKRAKA